MELKELSTLEKERFNELKKDIELEITFKKIDYKKQYSRRDVLVAGLLAVEIGGENIKLAEFFNLMLSILYGKLEY